MATKSFTRTIVIEDTSLFDELLKDYNSGKKSKIKTSIKDIDEVIKKSRANLLDKIIEKY